MSNISNMMKTDMLNMTIIHRIRIKQTIQIRIILTKMFRVITNNNQFNKSSNKK